MKKLSFILLIFIIGFSLCACGGKQSAPQPTAVPTEAPAGFDDLPLPLLLCLGYQRYHRFFPAVRKSRAGRRDLEERIGGSRCFSAQCAACCGRQSTGREKRAVGSEK